MKFYLVIVATYDYTTVVGRLDKEVAEKLYDKEFGAKDESVRCIHLIEVEGDFDLYFSDENEIDGEMLKSYNADD